MSGFDVAGDLALSSDGRRLLWWQGAEEVAHRVRVKLQIFRGIWHYDQRIGIRYRDAIFEKPSSIGVALLRAEVWRTLIETNGIVSVQYVRIGYDRQTRTATCVWRAMTDVGPTEGYVDWS